MTNQRPPARQPSSWPKPPIRRRDDRTPLPRRAGVSQLQPRVAIVHAQVTDPGTTVNPAVSARNGYRIHIRRIKIIEETSDGGKLVELFFVKKGVTAVDMLSNEAMDIDVIKVADGGEGNTRTWEPEEGPSGFIGEDLYYHFRTAPTSTVKYLFLFELYFSR